jgi:hypothetical protein
MNKRLSTPLLVVLKELNRSLVSFRGFPRAESTKVVSAAGLPVLLAGV